MLAGFVEKNPERKIIVNFKCETRIPGSPVIGDVTNVQHKKIVVASE